MTVEAVCRPLADLAAREARIKGTAFIGLCGAQGSGKSTIAAATVRMLQAEGLSAVALSLDDFYLGRDARAWLADKVHPLLAVRGPPGTHDVAVACRTLDALAHPGPLALPAFDKATDERRPKPAWRTVQAPVDVVLLEGWCVGALPQPDADLEAPVNALEAERDPNGQWRRYVNRQLRDLYQPLFARLDRLAFLQAPSFEVVTAWRTEQEHKLRARTGQGMTDAQVARFVQHYERLSRWLLAEAPSRADLVFELDAARRITGVRLPAEASVP